MGQPDGGTVQDPRQAGSETEAGYFWLPTVWQHTDRIRSGRILLDFLDLF
jgi:hypothetical protein